MEKISERYMSVQKYSNVHLYTVIISNVFIIKLTLYDYKYEKGLSDVFTYPYPVRRVLLEC